MKCEACGIEILEDRAEYTALGPVHQGPCPGTEDRHQKHVEAQARNMYVVYQDAMKNSCGIHMRNWAESSPETKQVWYTVTAAALGMHKF